MERYGEMTMRTNLFDIACIKCILRQHHFDIETDCEGCEHYYEKLANGEIYVEVENDIEEE